MEINAPFDEDLVVVEKIDLIYEVYDGAINFVVAKPNVQNNTKDVVVVVKIVNYFGKKVINQIEEVFKKVEVVGNDVLMVDNENQEVVYDLVVT